MRYNVIYYFLSVLLVMGAFASMAQNEYGTQILFGVALSFAVLFLVQLVKAVLKKGEVADIAELTSLIIIATILAMRVYYIHLRFVEILFGLAGLTLIVVQGVKAFRLLGQFHSKNTTITLLVVAFYGALIFYISSMTTVPFVYGLPKPLGVGGFALLLIFLLIGMVKRTTVVDGEKLFSFEVISKSAGRSKILVILFLLFTAYTGLTDVGLLPKMYSDEFPQAYLQLVKQAETGEDPSGIKYEEFKKKYDLFIKRHGPGK